VVVTTGTGSAGAPIANWAGNVRFTAARFHEPTSVTELQQIVAGAQRVKALGTGHSFSVIADTPGDLISTAALPRTIEIDPAARTATVGAGVRFAELAPRLEEHGLALHNLGSLPHISVTGACATGTHGSGARNGILAGAVQSLELVQADGSLHTLGTDELPAAVVGLGALGIVTSATLRLVPSYRLQQYVYRSLTRERLLENLDAILDAAYSVSVFTDWGDANEIWLKRLAADEPAEDEWLGARLADEQRPAGPGANPAHGTPQLGVAGPWHELLPHFRAEFTPSWGQELQSEYFVERRHAAAAVHAVFGLHDVLAPLLLISELRAIAGDQLWLSGAYGRDTVALHFTWGPDEPAVRIVVAELERRLAPFAARPHWGKVFCTSPDEIAALWPHAADFGTLRAQFDPEGAFGNAYLDIYLPMR
jgi:alditol oxidase